MRCIALPVDKWIVHPEIKRFVIGSCEGRLGGRSGSEIVEWIAVGIHGEGKD